MSIDSEKEEGPEEEGWENVGEGAPVAPEKEAGGGEETKVYEGKQPTPPWKVSTYTAVFGIVLALVILAFPELRRIDMPWDPSYPTAHFILVIPGFAILWALIGLTGKEYREDRSRALVGLALGVIAIALLYVAIVTDPALDSEGPAEQDPRLEMTPQQLEELRDEKLRL